MNEIILIVEEAPGAWTPRFVGPSFFIAALALGCALTAGAEGPTPTGASRDDWRRDIPLLAAPGLAPARIFRDPHEAHLHGWDRAWCLRIDPRTSICRCDMESYDAGGNIVVRDGRQVNKWEAMVFFGGLEMFEVLEGDLDRATDRTSRRGHRPRRPRAHQS